MKRTCCMAARFLAVVVGSAWAVIAVCDFPPVALAQDLAADLKKTGYRIVYETYQDGNWELFMVGVDGSPPVNLTRTPEVNELYPKVSPDGSKIAFVIDQGKGEATVRSVYYMNFDGTGRTLVGSNARWPCWSPGGQAIEPIAWRCARCSSPSVSTSPLPRTAARLWTWRWPRRRTRS